MSWFKKAKNLIKEPLDANGEMNVEKQIDIMAKMITHYYLTKQTQKFTLIPFVFIDPYTEKQRSIGVSVETKINTNSNREIKDIATFSIKNQHLTFLPHNLPDIYRKNTNKYDYDNLFKSIVWHELTHVVDPKNQYGNPFKGIEKKEILQKMKDDPKISDEEFMYNYNNFKLEFDAKCREIIEILRNWIKNQAIKDQLYKWLNGLDKKFPKFLEFALPIFNRWIKHDEISKGDKYQHVKLFKMRIINELFKDINPMIESQETIDRRKLIQQKLQQLNNSQRKAYHMSWFTKISRRPWSEIPFTDREVRPNTNPYSTQNEDYPEKSNITTIKVPGMGTNVHNSNEVSGDGESDSKVKDLTSFTDVDSIMYEDQVMDEDTGGKPRPRTTDTGGPYIGDQPMVLGLPDDAAGSFVVNYSPNEKTPQEVATDSFLNFQNRPSRKVQLNGRNVNIV